MLVLIPALMATGASGLRLTGTRAQGLIGAKKRRMPFIAANGILILIPSAVFLYLRAEAAFSTRRFMRFRQSNCWRAPSILP